MHSLVSHKHWRSSPCKKQASDPNQDMQALIHWGLRVYYFDYNIESSVFWIWQIIFNLKWSFSISLYKCFISGAISCTHHTYTHTHTIISNDHFPFQYYDTLIVSFWPSFFHFWIFILVAQVSSRYKWSALSIYDTQVPSTTGLMQGKFVLKVKNSLKCLISSAPSCLPISSPNFTYDLYWLLLNFCGPLY